jgi:hypothetical protein
MIGLEESARDRTRSANSRIEISCGLPILTIISEGPNALGQLQNRNLVRAANIDDFALGWLGGEQQQDGIETIADVGKVAALESVAEHPDGFTRQGSLNKVRQYHPVAAGLARSHNVEEARDDHRQVVGGGISQGQEFVQFFGSGV